MLSNTFKVSKSILYYFFFYSTTIQREILYVLLHYQLLFDSFSYSAYI